MLLSLYFIDGCGKDRICLEWKNGRCFEFTKKFPDLVNCGKKPGEPGWSTEVYGCRFPHYPIVPFNPKDPEQALEFTFIAGPRLVDRINTHGHSLFSDYEERQSKKTWRLPCTVHKRLTRISDVIAFAFRRLVSLASCSSHHHSLKRRRFRGTTSRARITCSSLCTTFQ